MPTRNLLSTRRLRCFGVFLSLAALAGCKGEVSNPTPPAQSGSPDVSVAAPAGDPSVPADQGGPGFTGEGWEPEGEFPIEGSPDAVKGGAIRYFVGTFPATLRFIGKDSNTTTNSLLEGMCYLRLLARHSDTMEFTPELASHWQVSDDKMTFRYRINPKAHWSDGKPVIADDVVATWDLYMDASILDPSMQVVFKKFERPVAVSKYIVEVKSKELNWRNFLYFSASMTILPAHQIADIDGTEFLKKFQFSLPVGCGPYEVQDSDIKKGQSITLRRRKDFWGWDERQNTGLYNFDLIRLIATASPDYVLAFERAKKGEVDIFRIGKAQDWVEAIPELPQVKRGTLSTVRIYNDEPMGTAGIAINMRVPPLDDLNVRKALAYAQNRKVMIDKLFFNEYVPLDSYHANSPYANPDNEVVRYNLEKAQELLSESGWTERDSSGVLVKDEKRLELDLIYFSKLQERSLTVYQEDCAKVGIKINLKQLNYTTGFQLVQGDRNFQLTSMLWTGLVDPNPETSWLSTLADEKNNNNINGFKDARVDEIIREYDQMFDPAERQAAIQELDGLVFRQHPYVLSWGADNIRLVYWNKFGMPPWYLGRTARDDSLLATWWIDPEKEKRLKAALEDDSITLDPGPKEVRYWRDRSQP